MQYLPDSDDAALALQHLVQMILRYESMVFTADDYNWHDYLPAWRNAGLCSTISPDGQQCPCPLCATRHIVQSQADGNYSLNCPECGLQILDQPEVWHSTKQQLSSFLAASLQLQPCYHQEISDGWMGRLEHPPFGWVLVHLVDSKHPAPEPKAPPGYIGILVLEPLLISQLFKTKDMSLTLHGPFYDHALETAVLQSGSLATIQALAKDALQQMIADNHFQNGDRERAKTWLMNKYHLPRRTAEQVWSECTPEQFRRKGKRSNTAK